VVAVAVVTLSLGWIVTGGTAERQAVERASEAVVSALAPICVHQAIADPKYGALMTPINDASYWQRGNMVVEAGWANMPGSDKAFSGVAEECARVLVDKYATKQAATK